MFHLPKRSFPGIKGALNVWDSYQKKLIFALAVQKYSDAVYRAPSTTQQHRRRRGQ